MESLVNYDPHLIISDRRQANKNKPYGHSQVARLYEPANWIDYPKDINNGEDMQEDSLSPALGGSPPQQYLSSIVAASTHITPLVIFSKKVNKRDSLEAMDIDEEDTARTPKKQKIENLGKLVQVAKAKVRKRLMKVKGPAFEI